MSCLRTLMVVMFTARHSATSSLGGQDPLAALTPVSTPKPGYPSSGKEKYLEQRCLVDNPRLAPWHSDRTLWWCLTGDTLGRSRRGLEPADLQETLPLANQRPPLSRGAQIFIGKHFVRQHIRACTRDFTAPFRGHHPASGLAHDFTRDSASIQQSTGADTFFGVHEG